MTPEQAVNGLFELLEKSAAEADALEAVVKRQASEIDLLKRAQPKTATNRPLLDTTALTKLAGLLEGEGLLPEGMNAKQAADDIMLNPNILIRWMHNLAAPSVVAEGRAVKAASETTTPISGDGKLVKIGSNVVVDHDGWADAIR